jgi:hypothetical protein
MLSRDGNLDGALEVVAQMAEQEGVPGLQEAAVSNKQMFQVPPPSLPQFGCFIRASRESGPRARESTL